MSLHVFWTPDGDTLDTIGGQKFVSVSDGDTPKIEMNIRMLSIDTPEKGPVARGLSKAEAVDLLPGLRAWIASGQSPVGPTLAAHLLPRLERDDAAAVHWSQGADATEHYRRITEARLTRPTGSRRRLFVRVADERFDRYGRLLAYVAPDYSAEERRTMSRRERSTFNFDMIESGWAASFILYPSIPGEADLPMVQDAARRAVEDDRGAWADPHALAGYEYRMLERLLLLHQKVAAGTQVTAVGWRDWITRYCADIETGILYPPQAYPRVAPWNRLFLWPADVRAAVAGLNLRPADGWAGL